MVGDLLGSGELELLFVGAGGVSQAKLTRPDNGLMTAADDGKGTGMAFEYARSQRVPGAFGRPVVLAAVTQRSSGYDDVTSLYDYEAPVVHPTSRALIGFGAVHRATPLTYGETRFHHDVDVSGVVLAETEGDVRSPYLRFVERDYDARELAGLAYLRLRRERRGLRGPDGRLELARVTSYDAYEAELCPRAVTDFRPENTLAHELERATPAGLADALHCLPRAERWIGSHVDASRDFAHAVAMARNSRGQVTEIRATDGAESLVLQSLEYTPDGRVASASVPGRGTTRYDYAPDTGLLAAVTTPDAVRDQVRAFDPVTDVIAALARDRGGPSPRLSHYAYDAFERLSSTWDDASGTSEARPLRELGYTLPTADAPGVVRERRYLGGAAAATVETAQLLTASGEALADAVVTADPGGARYWALSSLRRTARSEGEVAQLSREPLRLSALAPSPSYRALFASGVELSRATQTGFGLPLASSELVQDGVQRATATTRTLTAAGVEVAVTENGLALSWALQDGDGRVLARRDAAGAETRLDYDALGRLVRVTLPGGARHEVGYDGLGRIRSAHRTGQRTTRYAYAPGTSLLATKQIETAAGEPVRAIEYRRDAIGRVLREDHTLIATGETDQVRYDYDGVIDGVVREPDQRGHLTRVTARGVELRYVYDRADRLRRAESRFDDFRTAIDERDYYADGTLERQTTTILAADGVELQRVEQRWLYDELGRGVGYRVNGRDVLHTVYDARGRVTEVRGENTALQLDYDPQTHAPARLYPPGSR